MKVKELITFCKKRPSNISTNTCLHWLVIYVIGKTYGLLKPFVIVTCQFIALVASYSRTSRDTMLLVLKEIYGDMGIYTDNQIPQTILPFDITDGESSEEYYNQSSSRDPTLPMNENVNFYKTSS